MEPMTINAEVVSVTSASFKVKINERTVLVPATQVKGVERGRLTFHFRKDAMQIMKML